MQLYRERFGFSARKRLALSAIALFLVVAVLAGTPGVVAAKGNSYSGGNGWGRVKSMDKFVQKIGKSVEQQKDLRFNDLWDCLWAASSIAKMRGLGIVNGYDGNYFKPNDSVTQAEALTMMVRAFDLEDEAKEMADRFGLTYSQMGQSGYNQFSWYGTMYPGVSQDTRWALGYILLAVEEGWVKLSECTPEKAASRAWISKVMVRALDHESQAQAKMNATLPFSDKSAITASDIGYVAEAVAMGLFKGYDDGTFKPNRAVTRAEMATVLDRFLGGELPSDIPYLAVGAVKSVSNNKFSIIVASGATLNYTVSNDALIIVDGEPAALSTVKVGDVVEVLSNGKGVALLVTVTAHADDNDDDVVADGTITGEIVGIATPPALTLKISGTSNKTVTLANNCVIKNGSTVIAYSDLLLGDVVTVTIKAGKAEAIKVTSRADTTTNWSGTVQGVTSSSVGIDLVVKKDSTTKTFRLAGNVTVKYGSTTLTASDIAIGDTVELTISNNVVTKVKITARANTTTSWSGVVQGITSSSAGIDLIVKKDSTTKTFRLAGNVAVKYGSTTLTASDIAIGDTVELTISNNIVTNVKITSRVDTTTEWSGTVQGVTSSSAGIDLIVKKDSTTKTFRLASNVVVKYGTTTLTASDIAIGDQVELTVSSNVVTNVKITIRAADANKVIGVVQAITDSSAGVDLVLVQGTGTVTVRLANNAQVIYGSSTLTVADIQISDEVELTKNSSGAATVVKILNRGVFGNLGGTISAITKTASESVITLHSNGQTDVTVIVTDDTDISFGTTELTRDDLKLGDVVRVATTISGSTRTATAIRISSRSQ